MAEKKFLERIPDKFKCHMNKVGLTNAAWLLKQAQGRETFRC